jgi:asparagine synthetase B (glutamine-hydrolysing)
MCGIAGVICADSKAVGPAGRAMIHRGPDNDG